MSSCAEAGRHYTTQPNPATGKWARTGSMSTAREGRDATLLPGGDALVTAGVEGASGLFAERYNPATGQWTAASGGLAACSINTACRINSSATLLGDGDVLVAGGITGQNSHSGSTAAAILYDPAANAWTSTGSLNTARDFQTANLLANGQVLIAGGTHFANHVPTFLNNAELYNPLAAGFCGCATWSWRVRWGTRRSRDQCCAGDRPVRAPITTSPSPASAMIGPITAQIIWPFIPPD